MPSSNPPDITTTTWYIVIQATDNYEQSYEDVALLTTNQQEAVEKEKELDDTYGKIGIVEIVETYNS